jgi:DNA replication protein DnaC
MDQITRTMRDLHMPGMAAAWEAMCETRKIDSLSLRDGIDMLLQAEGDSRRTNRNNRLLKEAKFRYTSTIEELDFNSARGIEQSKVMQLATCDYIRNGIPVIITGAAGTGKSCLATALGHQACLMGMRVRYFGLQKLFEEITINRVAGTLPRFFDKMSATDLIIIDDFGLRRFDSQQMLDFMELIEDRHGRHATIFISQIPVKNWYDLMTENTTAADGILDRIVHTAIRFELKGDSLRKK